MTTTHEIGLTERALTVALLGKYLILFCYGVWAAFVEIPTFVVVGSSLFAVIWACIVTATTGLAAVGVIRSLVTQRRLFEHVATALFVLTFLGYFWALLWRAISTENWGGAPLALVPVAVCVLPTVRFYTVLMRSGLMHGRRARGVRS